MNKYHSLYRVGADSYIPLKEIIRKMKLTLFVVLISAIQIFAKDAYSQNTQFSLKKENTAIEAILGAIENQSEFYFLYNGKLVDVTQKVSINVENQVLEKTLNELFKNTDIAYKIYDRQVVLSPKANADLSQQQKSVTGKVTDSLGGPLPGVSVVVKGTTTGVITDFDGKYSISNIPENTTLQFSFVGMKAQEVAVGNNSYINVRLEEETIGIEEVVAVGYGTQKRGNLTGSVSSIKSEKLTIAPIANVTNSLAGQMPGLITKQGSGQPGSDGASLSIRGFDSPLVIVDGIQSDFSYLDASQIESVSILKDGSASIYGARAGNGVILVTTKRGQNQKPTITLNSSFTMQGSTKLIRPMSSGERAEWAREMHINAGLPISSVPYTEEDVKKYFEGTDPNYLNSDWFGAAIRSWAPQQNHDLSIRGGSEKIKYYGHFGYNDQETIIKNDGGDFKRYNVQSNIDANITDNLKISVDLSMNNSNSYSPSMGLGNGSNLWTALYWSESRYPITLPDPKYQSYAGNQNGNIFAGTSTKIGGYNDNKTRRMREGITLTYDFKKIKGLQAKASVNFLETSVEGKSFMTRNDFYTYDSKSQKYTKVMSSSSPTTLSQSSSHASDLTIQYSLSYDRTFNQVHHLTALALFESVDSKSNYFSAGRQGFLSNSIDQLFAGNNQTASNNGSASEMGRSSWINRLNYSFRDRYLIETILRYDASAKFPSKSRWGLFPSVSLGWIMSQENFMKSFNSVDNLKLRASYGQSGNDAVGNFQYLTGYAFGGAYMVGDNNIMGIYSTGLANPSLTWEKISISNIGLDFSFLKRKIYGTAEAFYRLREGIPATRITSLPNTFGASLPPENLNSIDTRGFEFLIGTSGKSGDFSYDVSGNISWSRSKWVKYEEPEYTDPDQKRIYQLTGQWTDRRIGYLSDGLFTSQAEINALPYVYKDLNSNSTLRPGDVKYLDTNNDKVLDWKDQQVIGEGSMPHWMYGVNTTFHYKNFDLTALFQGAFGFTSNIALDQKGSDDRLVQSVLLYDNRWTEATNNPNAKVPRPGGSSTNMLYSDYRNHSVSYLRLRSASLGYDIPNNLLTKVGFSKSRIYLAGTNLFTLSSVNKYGIDPEMQDGIKVGNYYPQQRTLSLGINLSF
jgi:TonB-linked SusC/RagA family outer membrane protein